MGLELGPPWLVVARDSETGAADILMRDNFTGSGLQRIISARGSEPGSFAAVIDKNGRFASHSDGSRYDPVEETKGRNGGTHAERGHRALNTASALFREMDEISRHRPSSTSSTHGPKRRIAIAVAVMLAVIVIYDLISGNSR